MIRLSVADVARHYGRRKALAHAARKSRNEVVGAVGEVGAFQRAKRGRARIGDAVEMSEELEVLP
ncbi:MAG TPA: hypothetical protein VNT81_18925, partial [Vicinamibacterales bacterium]|nr:hypothetical protein [Vicinamibacterales bacterium]